jgi:hypothetical protein
MSAPDTNAPQSMESPLHARVTQRDSLVVSGSSGVPASRKGSPKRGSLIMSGSPAVTR